MRALLPGLAMLAGCATEQITVSRSELLHHVVDLRTRGAATVDVGDAGTYEVSTSQQLAVTIGGKSIHMSLHDLIAGCPETAPFAGAPHVAPGCALLDTSENSFQVDTRHHVDWEPVKVVLGALLVVVVVGTVVGTVCSASASGC